MYGVAQNWQRQKGLEICQKEGKVFVCNEESDFSIIEVVNEHFILTWSECHSSLELTLVERRSVKKCRLSLLQWENKLNTNTTVNKNPFSLKFVFCCLYSLLMFALCPRSYLCSLHSTDFDSMHLHKVAKLTNTVFPVYKTNWCISWPYFVTVKLRF